MKNETLDVFIMANGLGISKEDFLSADKDRRDSMLWDNLVAIKSGIQSLTESESSRDMRAMAQGAKYGLLGGASAVCTLSIILITLKAMGVV